MLRYLKKRFAYWLEVGIGLSLPYLIRSALSSRLQAVWVKADWQQLPKQGFIFAPNHHSWWDVYLAWLVHSKLKRKVCAIMDDRQLGKFRFFRQIGVIGRKEVRTALRRLKAGDMLFIFPEGELRPAAKVEQLEQGVFFLARHASAPIYPLALRVVMRGAQYPEAYMVLGEKLELSGDPAQDTEKLRSVLNHLLYDLDRSLLETPPEQSPRGFECWLSGRQSLSQRTTWLGKLWS